MGDFFKGWRRKIGVATLVLALVFMAGWVRSKIVRDSVEFSTGQSSEQDWSSIDGSLCLKQVRIDSFEKSQGHTTVEEVTHDSPTRRKLDLETDDSDSPTTNEISETSWERPILLSTDCPYPTWRISPLDKQGLYKTVEEERWYFCGWRWFRCGFGVTDIHFTGDVVSGKVDVLSGTMYAIPYWSVVLPLTLLSAYLLVPKPPKSTPNKIIEPIPEKLA